LEILTNATVVDTTLCILASSNWFADAVDSPLMSLAEKLAFAATKVDEYGKLLTMLI
jgi:hypothetical protein